MMLEFLGYRVTAVNNSPEALRIFLACSKDFDLVLTDQTMPIITGVTLAEEILAQRPDMPIVLCTGYSDQIDREKALQLGISEFITKPYTAASLSTAIRSILDKKKSGGTK
jgi:CheY-like chemotaxis protein